MARSDGWENGFSPACMDSGWDVNVCMAYITRYLVKINY